MSISSIGKGLSILICCDFIVAHEWMSFLTYWSVKKNLTDASVTVACRRGATADLFHWARKCSVPLIFHSLEDPNEIRQLCLRNPRAKLSEPLLIVRPSVVFVRDFEEAGFDVSRLQGSNFEVDGLVSDARSDNTTVCCDYAGGWGNFNTSRWINRSSIPFSTEDFSARVMAPNEKRLAALWESASRMYQSIIRG